MSAKDDEERDKKASVIHTRVPEALDQEIKKRASGLGVSVSNLVRNVLLNTFGLVENVIADSASIAAAAKAPNAQPAPPPKVEIVAWQEITLNINAVCDRCNAILAKGSQAAIAIGTGPMPRPIFRCLPCVKELAHDR